MSRWESERPTLYVVATPIGNLADITLRALEVLKRVDAIAAEDTRVTARLLEHYGIAKRLIAVHEHNERRAAQRILRLLAQGKSVALVCDAGTPAISDPGRASRSRGARTPASRWCRYPGRTRPICALSAAGITAPHFLFYGFLPPQSGGARGASSPRCRAAVPAGVLRGAAPRHRERRRPGGGIRRRAPITIARELTKLFETIHACTLGEAAAWLAADPNRSKGEFVLIVEGAPAACDADPGAARRTARDPAARAAAQAGGGARRGDHAARSATTLYKLALELKQKS